MLSQCHALRLFHGYVAAGYGFDAADGFNTTEQEVRPSVTHADASACRPNAGTPLPFHRDVNRICANALLPCTSARACLSYSDKAVPCLSL